MKIKNSLLIILAGIFWGSMGIFVHLLTDFFGFSSLQAASLRMMSAAVILALFLLIKDKSLFKIKLCDVPILACNGVFSIFFMTVFYFASINSDTSMSVSAVLLYTAPFIVMLLSCIFLGEKLTVQKVICLVIAFAGCCLVSVSEQGYSTTAGIIFGILSGIAYALYSIFGSVALKKHHPYTVTFYSFFFAGLCSAVLAVVTQIGKTASATDKPFALIVSIIATGLITAVLPFLLYTKGLCGTPASKASVMAYAEPVSACVFGYFLMNEIMTGKMIFGILLTVVAIVLLNVSFLHKKTKILVSRCLLGEKCRYDGKSKEYTQIDRLKNKYTLIPLCPEEDGGLSTPRLPSEIKDGCVLMNDGTDVTEFFVRGAHKALDTAKKNGCTVAVLKAKSPSCGKGRIYDGSFSSTLTDGDGITAKLLKENGISVFTEEEIDKVLEMLEEEK